MDEIKTDLLVERCRKGDIEAFGHLVDIYQNKVYSLCLHLTGNRDDAQDLAQEAFIRAYRALPGFRSQSAFGTWLYRIVSNLWSNEIRKRRKQRTVPLDAPIRTGEGEISREAADEEANPEYIVESREKRDLVWQALDLLSEDQRTVLILREMHGYSYDEIARGLDCSVGTVKSRLNRARHNLAQRLGQMNTGDENL